MRQNTTTATFWELNIQLDRYEPICWNIKHANSTDTTVGVEAFDSNIIKGFYLNNTNDNISVSVHIVYKKL